MNWLTIAARSTYGFAKALFSGGNNSDDENKPMDFGSGRGRAPHEEMVGGGYRAGAAVSSIGMALNMNAQHLSSQSYAIGAYGV